MTSRILSLLCVMLCGLNAYAASTKKAFRYGRLPASFEENRGQTDARVKFLSRGPGYTVFLTSSEAVFSLKHGSERAAVTMSLIASNTTVAVKGVDALPGKSNYFIGN